MPLNMAVQDNTEISDLFFFTRNGLFEWSHSPPTLHSSPSFLFFSHPDKPSKGPSNPLLFPLLLFLLLHRFVACCFLRQIDFCSDLSDLSQVFSVLSIEQWLSLQVFSV